MASLGAVGPDMVLEEVEDESDELEELPLSLSDSLSGCSFQILVQQRQDQEVLQCPCRWNRLRWLGWKRARLW